MRAEVPSQGWSMSCSEAEIPWGKAVHPRRRKRTGRMADSPLWSHTQTFSAEAQSAFLARRFVRRHLVEHGLAHLVADVELVTSELATNALVHTRRSFALSLDHNARAVVVTVQDCSPSVPVMGVPNVMDTHGRGLFLVDSISHEWGVVEQGNGAASVWASFRTA